MYKSPLGCSRPFKFNSDVRLILFQFASRHARNAVFAQLRYMKKLYYNENSGLQVYDPENFKDKSDEQVSPREPLTYTIRDPNIQVNKYIKISKWAFVWHLAIDAFRLDLVNLHHKLELPTPIAADSLTELVFRNGMQQWRAHR